MSSIKLIQGSCVDQKADAIVNAANGDMMHAAGVARAILNKAGHRLNDACHKHVLPVKDGNCIVTPSFNMDNTKIIIHAVGPNFYYNKDAFKELFEAYYNSLISLKDYKYHSIAFPLISSGIFGGNLPNPVGESAKECIKAYNSFIDNYPDYEIDVTLCAYTDKEYNLALEEFKKNNI